MVDVVEFISGSVLIVQDLSYSILTELDQTGQRNLAGCSIRHYAYCLPERQTAYKSLRHLTLA